MNFCNRCGSPVASRIPAGDDRKRHICDNCNTIHYQNPLIVGGCLISHGDKILLCKRSIEPRKGYWTVPAGFMENGESTEECARRETWEEARAQVDIDGLYVMCSVPDINQVYLLFRGSLVGDDYAAGPESLDVQLFGEEDIPWDQLAFPIITTTLKHFFNDRRKNHFPLHSETQTFRHRQKNSDKG